MRDSEKPIVEENQDLHFAVLDKSISSLLFTFTRAPALALTPGDEEVRLLPELVTLTEVAAKFVLVLHHVPGDAEAHRPSSGRGQHTPGKPVLAAGVVVAGLKIMKIDIILCPEWPGESLLPSRRWSPRCPLDWEWTSAPFCSARAQR